MSTKHLQFHSFTELANGSRYGFFCTAELAETKVYPEPLAEDMSPTAEETARREKFLELMEKYISGLDCVFIQ